MSILIGIVVIIAGLICWIGQVLSFYSPHIAVKIGLCEPESEMDPTLYIIETKAHGLTDMLLTWILPASGFLMILEIEFWPILALIGSGIYLYFPGIIILHRIFLKKEEKKIGSSSAVIGTYVFGTLWILCAIAMIILSGMELNYF
jgi:hypothetical protein